MCAHGVSPQTGESNPSKPERSAPKLLRATSPNQWSQPPKLEGSPPKLVRATPSNWWGQPPQTGGISPQTGGITPQTGESSPPKLVRAALKVEQTAAEAGLGESHVLSSLPSWNQLRTLEAELVEGVFQAGLFLLEG